MAEKAIQIAPKQNREIKKTVSKKLNRTHMKMNNPIAQTLIALAGIFYILPTIAYGTLIFFSAGFKAGMESAIAMYNEGMKDARKWAR